MLTAKWPRWTIGELVAAACSCYTKKQKVGKTEDYRTMRRRRRRTKTKKRNKKGTIETHWGSPNWISPTAAKDKRMKRCVCDGSWPNERANESDRQRGNASRRSIDQKWSGAFWNTAVNGCHLSRCNEEDDEDDAEETNRQKMNTWRERTRKWYVVQAQTDVDKWHRKQTQRKHTNTSTDGDTAVMLMLSITALATVIGGSASAEVMTPADCLVAANYQRQ